MDWEELTLNLFSDAWGIFAGVFALYMWENGIDSLWRYFMIVVLVTISYKSLIRD